MTYTKNQMRQMYAAGRNGISFDLVLDVWGLFDANGKPEIKPAVVGISEPPKMNRRRGLTSTITGIIAAAGPKGMHISDIARAARIHPVTVTAWIHGTGKKFTQSGQLKKIARATYSFDASNHQGEGTAGGTAGAAAGGVVGGALGGLIGQALGFGAYDSYANEIICCK